MLRVGVDVGGTFTDLFAWDAEAPEERRVREAKVLSTPADPSIGVIQVLDAAGIDPAQIGTIIHGTTIATNALIERRYPEPALVTTTGFRDVLEIGRQRRQRLYEPYRDAAGGGVGAQASTMAPLLHADHTPPPRPSRCSSEGPNPAGRTRPRAAWVTFRVWLKRRG